MTVPGFFDIKCAVCGAISEQNVLISTNTMGPPDLDFRPALMARSTLSLQIQCCPKCGYCSKNIETSTPHAADIITKPDYKSLLRDKTIPLLARKYLCWAKIAEEEGDYISSFNAALDAAWVCDDEENLNGMIDSRKYAAYLIKKIHTKGLSLSYEKGIDELVLSDILRRIGNFEDAQRVIKSGQKNTTDSLLLKALFFENDLCEKRDIQCYSFESIDNEGRWEDSQ